MIDDDEDLTLLTQEYVKRFDIQLDIALHPKVGIEMLERTDYQALILDVMLPEMDGFEVCKRIRQSSNIPILMLTARGDLTDKVLGLELGCDDYLAKPFEPRELVARCQSLVRRAASSSVPSNANARGMDNNRLHLNAETLTLSLGGQQTELTAMEADALQLLMNNPGKVFSRDDLLNALKGIDTDIFSRSIDILISRIRSKIKLLTSQQVIYTLRGKGYRFWEEAHESA